MIDFRNMVVLGLAAVVGAEATWSMPLLSAAGLLVSLVWFWPFIKSHRLYAFSNVAVACFVSVMLPPTALNNIIALTMPFTITLFWYWARLRQLRHAAA